MLNIRGKFYNATNIRKLSRNNRNYLIITFIDGSLEDTDEFFGDIEFKQLVEEWERKLK